MDHSVSIARAEGQKTEAAEREIALIFEAAPLAAIAAPAIVGIIAGVIAGARLPDVAVRHIAEQSEAIVQGAIEHVGVDARIALRESRMLMVLRIIDVDGRVGIGIVEADRAVIAEEAGFDRDILVHAIAEARAGAYP